MKVYDTIHEAYLGSLADVYDNPDYVAAPRDQKTREKVDYAFRILNPKAEPIKTQDEKRNKTIESYTAKEVALYNEGDNTAEGMAKASKFWLQLANPDGTINSNYGYLVFKNRSHGNPAFEGMRKGENILFKDYASYIDFKTKYMRTPWEWCVQSLRNDKDTRQAILRFSLPEHQWMGNKDQTCTLHGIFMIRENKLNLTVTMRSNDLTLGLVYDLPWFVSLLYKMQKELKDVYPDLEIGYYGHQVHSLHIYDRDEERILKMLGRNND